MNKINNILCVHQGYELYGSDRSFVLSVSILKKIYPNSIIDVIIPKEGKIKKILEPLRCNILINKDLAILRKKDLRSNPLKLLYKIIKGTYNAIENAKKYDLIYINTIVVLDYILASRFIKKVNILHVREIPTGIQKLVFSKILSFSKMKIIFNSQNTAKSYNLSKTHVATTILNGVRGYKNQINNINDNVFKILIIGRLTKWKGQMLVLEAINKLVLKNKHKIKVRIVGDVFEDQIEYKNSLISYVKKNNLQNIVTFKSFTNDPEKEFSWSNIIVVPSIKPEPFGRVAIEAMSIGRCVVAANHGGLKEIISHKINGVLFEHNNVDSLISELNNIMHNPEYILKYGLNGKITFDENFSREVYEQKFRTTIERYTNKL